MYLDTRKSNKRIGHFQLHPALVIGHDSQGASRLPSCSTDASCVIHSPASIIGVDTIPFAMRQNARNFVDAVFDTSEGSGDGCRWWYINKWALSWSRERFEK